MDETQNGRRYEAGDTVKLEIVLRHRANLREVRAIFEHTHDRSVAPLIARGSPRPISKREADDFIRSHLRAELVIPGKVTPGVYELTRISYETAGGQLGHLPENVGLTDVAQMAFEIIGEPQDEPS